MILPQRESRSPPALNNKAPDPDEGSGAFCFWQHADEDRGGGRHDALRKSAWVFIVIFASGIRTAGGAGEPLPGTEPLAARRAIWRRRWWRASTGSSSARRRTRRSDGRLCGNGTRRRSTGTPRPWRATVSGWRRSWAWWTARKSGRAGAGGDHRPARAGRAGPGYRGVRGAVARHRRRVGRGADAGAGRRRGAGRARRGRRGAFRTRTRRRRCCAG